MLADRSAPPETRRAPADPFSQDQLESHAARIAPGHILTPDPGRPLMPRLDESAARLDEAYTFLSAAAKVDPQPSEDWLRDNHHVVQDQVRGIRQHLPGASYKELPKLAEGDFVDWYERPIGPVNRMCLMRAARCALA